PPLGRGEVLLAVTAVGICGSDLHYYREGGLGGLVADAPLILGHEFAARVEAVGAGVSLPVGTRVAVAPGRSCGRCGSCLGGQRRSSSRSRYRIVERPRSGWAQRRRSIRPPGRSGLLSGR